jgi:hypothetical protein
MPNDNVTAFAAPHQRSLRDAQIEATAKQLMKMDDGKGMLDEKEIYGAMIALGFVSEFGGAAGVRLAVDALIHLGCSEEYLLERLAEWEGEQKRQGLTDEDLADPEENPMRFFMRSFLDHPVWKAYRMKVDESE